MNPWEYEDFVRNYINKVGGMYPHYTTLSSGEVMKYSATKDILNINTNVLYNVLMNKPYPNLSDEEVLTIMVCHEMGHIKEVRKNQDYIIDESIEILGSKDSNRWKEWILEREQKAWEIGRQYVPEKLLSEYDDFNKQNLEIYKSI